MREEMGWSVAAISFGFSLRSFEQGLLAPVSGVLVDRIGPRRMTFVGVALLAGGLLLFSQARELWVYYVASVMAAFGQSLAGGTPLNAAVMQWFERKRGRAMGLVAAGRGAGYFVVPLFALLVARVGWREGLVASALLIGAVGMVLALVTRDRPEQYGLRPDGRIDPAAAASTVERGQSAGGGMSVREALHTPAFYLLTLSNGLAAGVSVAWTVHQVPHMQDVGVSLRAATLVVAVYGGVQVATRPFVGWLADIVGRQRLYVSSFVLQGVGLVAFALLDGSRLWLLGPYYLTYATGHATWVILYLTTVADTFGTRRFATLQGLASVLTMPFGVLAPLLAGAMFDATGSYRLIFAIFAPLTAVAALLVMAIGRPPRERSAEVVRA